MQNTTVIYSSAITNTNLKVPTLGITDLGYKVQSGDIMMLVVVVRYTQTYLIFQTQVNANSRLNTLKITYMALDNSFTPAFSMNYFFPVLLPLSRTSTRMGVHGRFNTSSTSQLQRECCWIQVMITHCCPSCTTSNAPVTITPSICNSISAWSTVVSTELPSAPPPTSTSGNDLSHSDTLASADSSSTKLQLRPWAAITSTTA